ncbi:F-box protein SKIP19-like isoform X1 [Cucumis melo var. makuwa]|uniref:F-box protein SKIP19-like isoform X1 n=1 Tax=Cucumis melo var. makuwa TaxID=1194695 RepID=A0A5A7SK46_CUCMM|nr:F-box protein SKIP19-like isoform X1 [Cucumis melo var. makuwa]
MRYPDDWWDMDYDLEEICKQAVERSCGQLIDINIGAAAAKMTDGGGDKEDEWRRAVGR